MDKAISSDSKIGTSSREKVLVVILDGYGFDVKKEKTILKNVIDNLPKNILAIINDFVDNIDPGVFDQDYNNVKQELPYQLISPTPLTYRSITGQIELPDDVDIKKIHKLREQLFELLNKEPDAIRMIENLIYVEAEKQHYSIWTARTPYIFSLRRNFPTVVTKTSGLEVGYEKLVPEVQGNSETGHQQLGNLCVAVQPPLAITLSIENGEFFKNEYLVECMNKIASTSANLNACILLSGEEGDDGRVHSCWNHLEAFLKLYFEHHHLKPSKLRLQVILDGRDAPSHSSIKEESGKYNFLGKLQNLLRKYDAEDSIAWVVGRSFAMDRDYDEIKAKTDYQFLTKGEGLQVKDVDEAIHKISEFHNKGYTDAYIDPIVVQDRNGDVRCVQNGDVFVDLKFRADRQREKIASLLGAKEFLRHEVAMKKGEWKLDWIDDDLKVDVYCMTEYHPDLRTKYGAKILYQTAPHEHNYLNITSKASVESGFKFKYMLLAESTKALHVGYFIRGRREEVESGSECEDRIIVPSFGHEADVNSDDEYYKTPQMKAYEIKDVLKEKLSEENYDLIITNFSNPDMLGHLIVDHFDAVVKGVEVMEEVVKKIIPLAQKKGYNVIITSDHGNADDFSPKHGSNDVLTSFISPYKNLTLNLKGQKAKLFDIPWCALEIMGIKDHVDKYIPEFPQELKEKSLVGSSLVEIEELVGNKR